MGLWKFNLKIIQDDELLLERFALSQFGKDAIFKDLNVFLWENLFLHHFFWFFQHSSFFFKINNILRAEDKLLRIRKIMYPFNRKYITFSIFNKLKNFFFEKPIYLWKSPNFWTFWEVLLLQAHSTAKLLPSAILKKFKIFFEKPINLLKKPQHLNVISVATSGKFGKNWLKKKLIFKHVNKRCWFAYASPTGKIG